ncbi:MAG TPA: hypothetical protein PK112_02925, partial [candidate division Zixibacteria bacterium]|nr:hypothetical protein [candidate division Zixibacteria bacterium]
MSRSRLRDLLTCAVTTAALVAAVAFSASAADRPAMLLTDQPVVQAKAAPVLSDRARAYLAGQAADTVGVWVFFTDKGIRTKDEFSARAASVAMTDKVLQRRAKVDRDRVLFADLPVAAGYVDAVVAAGGHHRRTSRWLNAASF